MFLVGIAVFLLTPVIEIYVIVKVGESIGYIPTFGLLIAISVLGTSLIKREGLRVLRAFSEQVNKGEMPSQQIVEGISILIAGALLLAPGFVTDAIGLLLLLPPVRALAIKLVMRRTTQKVTVIRATYDGPIVEVRGQILGTNNEIIDVESSEGEENE